MTDRNEFKKAEKASTMAVREFAVPLSAENELRDYLLAEVDLERKTVIGTAMSAAQYYAQTRGGHASVLIFSKLNNYAKRVRRDWK